MGFLFLLLVPSLFPAHSTHSSLLTSFQFAAKLSLNFYVGKMEFGSCRVSWVRRSNEIIHRYAQKGLEYCADFCIFFEGWRRHRPSMTREKWNEFAILERSGDKVDKMCRFLLFSFWIQLIFFFFFRLEQRTQRKGCRCAQLFFQGHRKGSQEDAAKKKSYRDDDGEHFRVRFWVYSTCWWWFVCCSE